MTIRSRILALAALVLILATSACGAAKSEKPITCSYNAGTEIRGHRGFLVAFVSRPMSVTWTFDTKDKYWDTKFTRSDNDEKVASQEIQSKVDGFNKAIAMLYPEKFPVPQLQDDRNNNRYFFRYDLEHKPSCADMKRVASASYSLHDPSVSEKDYRTVTKYKDGMVYVTVSTPGGSSVVYSFPEAVLNKLEATFKDGEPFSFIPQIVTPATGSTTKEGYTDSMVESLFSTDQGREAVAFNLNVSDFEGRQVLRPVLAKALSVVAAAEGKPVTAVLRAMMSNGGRSMANVSVSGGTFSTSHWYAFGTSSGTGPSVTSTYQGWIEDVVRGSIYLTSAQ